MNNTERSRPWKEVVVLTDPQGGGAPHPTGPHGDIPASARRQKGLRRKQGPVSLLQFLQEGMDKSGGPTSENLGLDASNYFGGLCAAEAVSSCPGPGPWVM